MTPGRERLAGVLWYAVTALIVAAGAVWWVRAAPDSGVDSRLTGWRVAAEDVLPDRSDQIDAGTFVLRSDTATEAETDAAAGRHVLEVVCAGQGQARMRLGATGDDDVSRTVPCADSPRPVTLSVTLAVGFYLTVNGDTDSVGMFRWRLTRLPA